VEFFGFFLAEHYPVSYAQQYQKSPLSAHSEQYGVSPYYWIPPGYEYFEIPISQSYYPADPV